jgi:quercetin dioxygenase-like cupin family protein
MQAVRIDEVEGWEAFRGVRGRVPLCGERVTIFYVEIEAGRGVPEHSHPHEQVGICLRGRAEFLAGGEKKIIEAGMVYCFAPNEMHSVRVIGDETGAFLDIFSPPREEYIKRQQSVNAQYRERSNI